MDIEALNTFLTLANTKNYTRTAAQLFVAQSTVTNRIHELEKELNIALFTRNNRSVELTVEGEQFKDYAEKVITLTNASLSEISSLHKYENHLAHRLFRFDLRRTSGANHLRASKTISE